jgi:hypothetical protein
MTAPGRRSLAPGPGWARGPGCSSPSSSGWTCGTAARRGHCHAEQQRGDLVGAVRTVSGSIASGQSVRRTVPEDNEDAAYLRALYGKAESASPRARSSARSPHGRDH